MGAVVALDGLLAARRVWRGQPVASPASVPEPTGHAALDEALPMGGWPEHARGMRAMELKQLYTDPQLTGHGIGAALIDWAMAETKARGADEIQLSVWSGNHGAQKFYAR